ncbi:hypothetical protein FB451DRAFT_1066243 [Mycena latifolia]|nr:hypothetical protein FB451DRAFT_1066243 [Mycena latifolia]
MLTARPTFHLQPAYKKWATKSGFESRLEADVKARNAAAATAAEDAAKALHQQTLEPHLRDKPARAEPYTDQLWLDATLEWLIATDQVKLHVSSFHSMIDIVARATSGVTIPGRNATREDIMKLFHAQMDKLRIRLHVSKYFSGPSMDSLVGKT